MSNKIKKQIVEVTFKNKEKYKCCDVCNCKVGDNVLVVPKYSHEKIEGQVTCIVAQTSDTIAGDILCKITSQYTLAQDTLREANNELCKLSNEMEDLVRSVHPIDVAKTMTTSPYCDKDVRDTLKNMLSRIDDLKETIKSARQAMGHDDENA